MILITAFMSKLNYYIFFQFLISNFGLLNNLQLNTCTQKLKGERVYREVAELVRSRLFLGLFHEHENGAVKILLLVDGSSASGCR